MAEIPGPSLAGWLIQVATAPLAILLDAVSFLLSGLSLSLIRKAEAAPQRADETEHLLSEIGAGVRLLLGNATLRALTATTVMISFFNAALEAIYLLYMTRTLGLSAGWIGLIFGTGSLGFLLGAILPNHFVKRFGLGRTMIAGLTLIALADLLLPLAAGPQPFIITLFIAAQICCGVVVTFSNIGYGGLRHSFTPQRPSTLHAMRT